MLPLQLPRLGDAIDTEPAFERFGSSLGCDGLKVGFGAIERLVMIFLLS